MGRKHAEGRAVASMCDLLDAAAAHAGVPLLAIVTVLSAKREINKQAWVKEYGDLREKIFERSRNHVFTEQDYHLIRGALDDLAPRETKLAWASVNEKYPLKILFGRLTGNDLADDRRTNDAIEDLGTDEAARVLATGYRYARDPKVRKAVLQRAKGSCEHCGAQGFLMSDNKRYLETHHIIALARQGEDRITNVIALCPNDHRQAHFGIRREEIEAEMIKKLNAINRN